MFQTKLTVVERVHLQSSKFAMGVTNKATEGNQNLLMAFLIEDFCLRLVTRRIVRSFLIPRPVL